MKKLLITQLLLLLTLVTFAQTTPTKEETIKWIISKITADNKGFNTYLGVKINGESGVQNPL